MPNKQHSQCLWVLYLVDVFPYGMLIAADVAGYAWVMQTRDEKHSSVSTFNLPVFRSKHFLCFSFVYGHCRPHRVCSGLQLCIPTCSGAFHSRGSNFIICIFFLLQIFMEFTVISPRNAASPSSACAKDYLAHSLDKAVTVLKPKE